MIARTALIRENVEQVQEQIDAAARRSGRSLADVLLVAVTKTHEPEMIAAAYAAGLRHFGENRVEEAKQKIAAVDRMLPQAATWHMIGHVQSRKAADVPQLFEWVHSVDRWKIARRLSEAASAAGRTLDALLEVNLSGEDTKYGYDLSRWPEDETQVEAFLNEIVAMLALPGLRWQGLMTMAPFTTQPETVRPVFRRLRMLRDVLRARFPDMGWPHLSMGMSSDYVVAVEEGATMVRIGTAIFGPRGD